MSTAFAAKPAEAPAALTSAWLDLETAAPAESRVSEALFIASAIAGWANPLRNPELSTHCVNNILFSVLREHTHSEVIAWRSRVARPEWAMRWHWAAETTHRLYADVLDVRGVPLQLDDLPEAVVR